MGYNYNLKNTQDRRKILEMLHILSGKKSRLEWNTKLRVAQGPQDVTLQIPGDQVKEEYLVRGLGYLLYSPLSQIFTSPGHQKIFDIIEAGRVDRMASTWFDKDLTGIGKGKVSDRGLISSLLQDLQQVVYGSEPKGIFGWLVNRFKKQIIEAVQDNEPKKAIAVTSKLAEFFNWSLTLPSPSEEKKDDLDEGEPTGKTTNGKETGEGGPPQSRTAKKLDPPTPGGDSPSKPSKEKAKQGAKDKDSSLKPSSTSVDLKSGQKVVMKGHSGCMEEFYLSPEWEQSLEVAADRATTDALDRYQRYKDSFKDNAGTSFHVIHHNFEMLEIEQEKFNVPDLMKLELDKWADSSAPPVRTMTGTPTQKVWKLNYGEVKVFTKRKVTAGQIVVMIDLSGSMGNYWNVGGSGYLAFVAASMIATSMKDEVTVYGFCSTDYMSYIVPFKPGHAPAPHVDVPNGNPDCVALQYLAETTANLEASIAVIISDGQPAGPAPFGGGHLQEHTKELAYELYRQGLKYVSILVGPHGSKDLYPADIRLTVTQVNDLKALPEVIERVMKGNE